VYIGFSCFFQYIKRVKNREKPVALLIYPPVYDFALYDLYVKPFGLLRIAGRLSASGWEVVVINALDIRYDRNTGTLSENTRHASGVNGQKLPKRKPDGTGKFFKTEVKKPSAISHIPRRFSRYGIPQELYENKIRDVSPDFVFISSGMTYWYLGVKETVETVRRLHPGIPVVVGGIYATLMESHCRSIVGPDYTITGEAWNALSELLYSCNLPVSRLEDEGIDFPYDAYFWNDAGVLRLNTGCPFSCTYCASGTLCDRFRPGDPARAFRQLTGFLGVGITNIAFYDDALLVNKNDVLLPFLEMVVASGVNVNFYLPNAVHMQFLDDATARLMRRTGFREIRMGFESASDSFHDKHDGKLTTAELPKAMEVLQSAGFGKTEIKVYILAGLPGQSPEEIEDSIQFASDRGAAVFLSEYSPVPGTQLWQQCVDSSRYPLEDEPLYHNNTIFPMAREGFGRSELEDLKRSAREKRPK
jgi:hypothetical protein